MPAGTLNNCKGRRDTLLAPHVRSDDVCGTFRVAHINSMSSSHTTHLRDILVKPKVLATIGRFVELESVFGRSMGTTQSQQNVPLETHLQQFAAISKMHH